MEPNRIVVISCDYDGCGECLGPFNEDRDKRYFHPQLKNELINSFKQALALGKVASYFISGSTRQTPELEYMGHDRHKNGISLTQYGKAFKPKGSLFQLAEKNKLEFDKTTLLKMLNPQDEDDDDQIYLTRISDRLEDKYHDDELKTHLITKQIDYMKNKHQDKLIEFHFYDDRSDILWNLHEAINLPDNVILHLYQVTPDQVKNFKIARCNLKSIEKHVADLFSNSPEKEKVTALAKYMLELRDCNGAYTCPIKIKDQLKNNGQLAEVVKTVLIEHYTPTIGEYAAVAMCNFLLTLCGLATAGFALAMNRYMNKSFFFTTRQRALSENHTANILRMPPTSLRAQ